MISTEMLKKGAERIKFLLSKPEEWGRTMMMEVTTDGIRISAIMRSSRETGADYFTSVLIPWKKFDATIEMTLIKAIDNVAAGVGIKVDD